MNCPAHFPAFTSALPSTTAVGRTAILKCGDSAKVMKSILTNSVSVVIHHVLAERKFTPPGMVFPVSTVMFERIDDYRLTLQAHTGPLMDSIDWRALPNGNVDVTNDTGDLYRFFDCTAAAEFLYDCVKRTVEEDLPREIKYIQAHDAAMRNLMNAIEMPDRLAAGLITFIRQNDGRLHSGLIDHIQKMTMAAMAMAYMKVCAHATTQKRRVA